MIVTYNSAEIIAACVEALHKIAPATRTLVIDNASTDGTVALVRRRADVEVLANSENRGFAGGVNQGFRASTEDLVLVLNPDVRLTTPLDDLMTAARQNGIAAGLLCDEAGRPQQGFAVRRLPTPRTLVFELLGVNRFWPGNPVNRLYRCADLDLSAEGPVEQPAGAFLMIRRDVWEGLHGFDEGFHPVWFEDVDFCKRAGDAGYRIEFVPAVRAAHTGGHSVAQIPRGCGARFWYGSLLRYAAKHYRGWSYRWVCLAAALGAVPRMVAGVMGQRSWAPVKTYTGIIRFALKRLQGKGV